MNTNLSILFYAKRAKATTDGLIPIYLRVTINGQRFEVSTKRYVEESKWSSQAGKVKSNINTDEARSINTFIDTLRNRVYHLQKEIVQEAQPFNFETFKNKWLGISEKPRMLFEIFQHHNDQLKEFIRAGEFAAGTLDRYKTSLQHTRNFIKWKYNVSDIDIRRLNYDFITDYEYWLKTIRSCNHNTSMKYIGNFKKIINICRKKSWLEKDPFYGFKTTKREVIREFLNEQEMQTIHNKVFACFRINQVKDIFLFCCYTGLAYVDVKKLKRSEITIGIDGEKWIYTSRQKTDTISHIPLLPPALEILDHYQNDPQCLNKDVLLPVLSNQKMNAYLKEIADICGIQKNLTFHMARHTFATTVTLSNNVPIETVSKMLGHKSLQQTQHYAKILDKKVSSDMQILRGKFANNLQGVSNQKIGS